MATASTSSRDDDKAPSTPAEKSAAAEYAKQLDAELDAEFSKEDGVNAPESEKEEPAENLDSENETEQEQEPSEEVSVASEPELSPKELRYKEQLLGEKKANAELQAKLQSLEAKVTTLATPQEKKELTPEEQQILAEKQYLKEKYGVVTKEDYDALDAKLNAALDAKFKPVQQKREQSILQNLYKKFPEVSPDKDPSNDKWNQVQTMLSRFVPSNPGDPLDDYEERFEWAYEKSFGKKMNYAPARQTSFTSVGGGSSAAKSRTTVGNDKYAHLSPEAKAYKARLDEYFDEEDKKEEAMKKRR
mgnify:CR=1 FL=1